MSQERAGSGRTAATFSETSTLGYGPHLECHISENTYWTNTLGFPGGAIVVTIIAALPMQKPQETQVQSWVKKSPE